MEMNVISCFFIGQSWEQFSERQNIFSFQLKSAFSILILHSVQDTTVHVDAPDTEYFTLLVWEILFVKTIVLLKQK